MQTKIENARFEWIKHKQNNRKKNRKKKESRISTAYLFCYFLVVFTRHRVGEKEKKKKENFSELIWESLQCSFSIVFIINFLWEVFENVCFNNFNFISISHFKLSPLLTNILFNLVHVIRLAALVLKWLNTFWVVHPRIKKAHYQIWNLVYVVWNLMKMIR